jgi:hypothetical protein
MLSRLAAVVAAAAATAVAAPPAWAPKYILGSNAYGDCVLEASTAQFQGEATILGFSSSGGELLATLLVRGVCVDGTTVVATVPEASYVFPVAVSASCALDGAAVEVRPGEAAVRGLVGPDVRDAVSATFIVDLSRGTVVDQIWLPNDPVALRARLCAVARLTAHRPAASLATVLNALLLG